MLLIQTFISISSAVLQNCLFNNVCKKELETNDHIYRFNMIMYAVYCIVWDSFFGRTSVFFYSCFGTFVLIYF